MLAGRKLIPLFVLGKETESTGLVWDMAPMLWGVEKQKSQDNHWVAISVSCHLLPCQWGRELEIMGANIRAGFPSAMHTNTLLGWHSPSPTWEGKKGSPRCLPPPACISSHPAEGLSKKQPQREDKHKRNMLQGHSQMVQKGNKFLQSFWSICRSLLDKWPLWWSLLFCF